LGMENDKKLQERLLGENIDPFLSKSVLVKFYNNFKTVNAITYSHPLSMLLTLVVWYCKTNNLKRY